MLLHCTRSQSGVSRRSRVDTTFDLCSRNVNLSTISITEFIPGNSESFVFYCNALKALFAASHVVLRDIEPCLLHECTLCRLLATLRGKNSIKRFLHTQKAKDLSFPVASLMGDEHLGSDKVAKALGVNKNKCVHHKLVIAKKGGKMIKYFSSREAFDLFYDIVSRAIHVAIPVIVDRVQLLISEYLEIQEESTPKNGMTSSNTYVHWTYVSE